MVSILSFDTRSIQELLSSKNDKYFEIEYPIFFKNKIKKHNVNDEDVYFYRSAIDNAVRKNQVRAVSYMVDYIVKYQNSYISSFLFKKNFPVLLEKGIEVSSLLNSNIFCYSFDYDEWPSTHYHQESYIRAYNSSIFDLRYKYREIFHEDKFAVQTDQDSRKVYTVNYRINMIPMLGEHVEHIEHGADNNELKLVNEGLSLIELCIDSE